MKKVKILGTKYTIELKTEEEEPKLEKCDGFVDCYSKKIVVGKFKRDTMSVEDLEKYTKKVLRHEIIHAFLHESGLAENTGSVDAWATFEEIVDWIALQFPKIQKAFKKARCA